MILLENNLGDVAKAISKARAYKDHLMKFITLQIPASIAAIALVLSQVFLYDTIFVTAVFIFLINLIYFPLGIVCMTRENSTKRQDAMAERWRSIRYPGSKTITGYMKTEYMKFTLLVLTIYQIGVLAALYFEADRLFTLVDQDPLEWANSDKLFIDKAWMEKHAEHVADAELFDLTDKGKMFLVIF